MNLSRRLEQLERDLKIEEQQTDEAESQAHWEREIELWNELASTMAPQHVDIIKREMLAVWTGQMDWYGPKGDRPTNLTRQARYLVSQAFHGKLIGPLALPAAVAEVYLKHDQASPMLQCEDCGLAIPITVHSGYPGGPPTRYFHACPVCEGRVGSRYFEYKHDPELRRRAFGDDRWPREDGS